MSLLWQTLLPIVMMLAAVLALLIWATIASRHEHDWGKEEESDD